MGDVAKFSVIRKSADNPGVLGDINLKDVVAVSCLLNSMTEGACLTDKNGFILDVNPAMSSITGYSKDELIGKTPAIFHSGFHDQDFYAKMWKEINENGVWAGYVWNRRKNGEIYNQHIRIQPVHKGQAILGYLGICRDLSAAGSFLGTHAGLVNQSSRASFVTCLHQCRASSGSVESYCAICVMDVDDFKLVNEQYGYAFGDKVLLEIMARLRAELSHEDAVTRLGGDEFAFIVKGEHDLEAIRSRLRRIVASINAVMRIDGYEIRVEVGIGVTISPFDTSEPEILIRHADEAMYEAKRAGRNQVHYFDMREHIAAMYKGEMELWYQPKIDLHSYEVLGVEALIRWRHPQHGIIPPGDFMRQARSRRVLIEIGEWALRTAVNQLADWYTKYGVVLPISVNLVAQHLVEPGFPKRLLRLFDEHPNIPPSALEIEILESDAIVDEDEVAVVMRACQDMGFTFAMDDFGTGYASLSHLRRFPVDTLKIDRFFVQQMLEDSGSYAIVEGVVRMANTFNCRVIAEGIETAGIANALLALGCKFGQGYAIARPMPADELISWSSKWNGVLD